MEDPFVVCDSVTAPLHQRNESYRKLRDHLHLPGLNISQETLFGRTVTPAERLRQHQRSLTKAQRELDRERTKLEQSEKKLIMDIKKSAKAGQLVHFTPISCV